MLRKIKLYKNNIVKKISKRRLLSVIFVVLVATSLVIGYFIYNTPIKNNASKIQTTSLSSEQTILLIDEVDQLLDQGNYSSAKSKINEAVERVADNKSKYLLLKDLSSVYYNEKNYDQALKTIQAAISADPGGVTSGTYDLMAGIYVGLGDKENATKYYQEAINQLDGEDDWEKNRIGSFQEEIDNLRGDANR